MIYLYWGINHAITVNQNPLSSDQHAYLSIAQQAYETDFQYYGDRNRMPIYPDLLALIYRPDMSNDVFFLLGKIFSVLFSFMLLLSLLLIFQHFFSKGKAVLLTTIIGSSLFIYKSGYIQPELLFYSMYFISYMMMLKMINEPNIKLGIASGVVIAVTYLVKASVLPSLIIFLGLLLLKQLISIRKSIKSGINEFFQSIGLTFTPLLAVLISFILILAPYLSENKKLFGKYFYNVNSTFYIWYDSWDSVVKGTMAYGDRVGWPNLPDDEIPTMQKYFKEHSAQQISDRFKLGAQSQLKNIADQYSFFNYPLIYSVVLIVCSGMNLSGTLKVAKKNIYQIFFFFLIMVSNLVLFAWYSPITNYLDARFTYGLYIPYLYSIYLSTNHISKKNYWTSKVPFAMKTFPLFIFEVANLIVVGLLTFEFLYHIPSEMAIGWFGK
jgi:hypothetical protein